MELKGYRSTESKNNLYATISSAAYNIYKQIYAKDQGYDYTEEFSYFLFSIGVTLAMKGNLTIANE